VATGPVPVPVGQVRLRLQNDTAYADLRGATQCSLIGSERRDQILAQLGEDPLRPDAQPDRVWARIAQSSRPIGDLLMDQSVLAGVGNVYRAEILFRHRIHPLRPGRTLRRGQFRALWADLVELMEYGVLTGRIDTVRPEHTPEAMGRPPRDDDHGGEVYVYRRHGQECLVCGARVRTDTLAGRNLFWCARCQPVFRSRAVG
jgi:formamidopyrimidine-DNA glycosylase